MPREEAAVTDLPGREALAASRWDHLVAERLEEMERLCPGRGELDGSFWDQRADRFAAAVRLADESEPFLRRLRKVAGPASTAIDVGAGTGRFALRLAQGVRHVTAVDVSSGMLGVLRRGAAELNLTNLTSIHGSWEQADVAPADIVFSSFVLTVVPDVRAFVAKLERTATRHVFLYLGAYSGDAVLDPLWRHFHDKPRSPGPTYLDALSVLSELGIAAEVQVVELPNRKRFATIDEAVEHYLDGLLVADTPDVREELGGLLAHWLLGRKGAFRSPLRSSPAAIIHWTPETRP